MEFRIGVRCPEIPGSDIHAQHEKSPRIIHCGHMPQRMHTPSKTPEKPRAFDGNAPREDPENPIFRGPARGSGKSRIPEDPGLERPGRVVAGLPAKSRDHLGRQP